MHEKQLELIGGRNHMLWIRIGFNEDQDPAFWVNADLHPVPDPDPGF
jgi:hypothetical protein